MSSARLNRPPTHTATAMVCMKSFSMETPPISSSAAAWLDRLMAKRAPAPRAVANSVSAVFSTRPRITNSATPAATANPTRITHSRPHSVSDTSDHTGPARAARGDVSYTTEACIASLSADMDRNTASAAHASVMVLRESAERSLPIPSDATPARAGVETSGRNAGTPTSARPLTSTSHRTNGSMGDWRSG